jgi:hypothetical protein
MYISLVKNKIPMTQDQDPQDYSRPSEEDDSADRRQRRQELELQEEELRLRQEETRLQDAKRSLVKLRATQGISFLVGALEILLGLRFFLQLVGANKENIFASVIYDFSHPFLLPFADLFTNPSLGEAGNVLEFSTILAMIVYGLLSILANRLVEMLG